MTERQAAYDWCNGSFFIIQNESCENSKPLSIQFKAHYGE